MSLKKIAPFELNENIFKLISKKWMLITATKDGKANTMTASWGGMGFIWNKCMSMCVVRNVRYTYEFMEACDYYTLSFFPEEYKSALNLLGTKSGRDCDKIAESKLTLADCTNDTKTFEEADIVMVCKKMYFDDIKNENFIDAKIGDFYPNKDYHRMYIGEIVDCFLKE